jgi:cytochrome bd-type quinol oxidase subunit 2
VNDYRLIMTGVALVAVLAAFTSVWPALDAVLVALILTAAGSAVAGYWLREAAREYRFRRDMRALDARDAACPARQEVPV